MGAGMIVLYVILGIIFLVGLITSGYVFIKYFLGPIVLFPYVFVTWLYMKRNPEYLSKQDHAAVVLVSPNLFEKYIMYTDGVLFLLMDLKQRKKAYKLYENVDRVKLKKIINNEKVKSVYLFGHGQKHGIKIRKKDFVYYCELKNAPKKDFVAQLHCNHHYGESLADFISKDAYVVNGLRTNFHNTRFFIKQYLKGRQEQQPKDT